MAKLLSVPWNHSVEKWCKGGFHVCYFCLLPWVCTQLENKLRSHGRVHGCRYLGRRLQRNGSQLYLVGLVVKYCFQDNKGNIRLKVKFETLFSVYKNTYWINNTKVINYLQESCLSRPISCVHSQTCKVLYNLAALIMYPPQSHRKDYTAKIASMQLKVKSTEIRNVWLKSKINLNELLMIVLHRTLGTCDVFHKESHSPKLTKKICKVVGDTL